MATQPLIINNWQEGIADSPHLGVGLLRNVDIEAFPGAVKVQKSPATLFHTALSATFTAVAATDVCTLGSGTVAAADVGMAVYLTTTGTLPAGLTTATKYYVIYGGTSTTFKLASTISNAEAGTAVDITGTGTGTHTVTTINPGIINHIIRDPKIDVRFFHDSNGRVWYVAGSGTRCRLISFNNTIDTGASAITNASGKGIVTFTSGDGLKTYLIAFRNALVDIVEVTTTALREAPTWINSWDFGGDAGSDTALYTAVGSSNSHHAIVGQDNIIYLSLIHI